MEKIKPEKTIDYFSEEFSIDSDKWKLDTQWGDIALFRPGSEFVFILEPERSSIVNLSLIVMALRKARKDVSYTFDEMKEKKKITLMIKTAVETLTYHFHEHLLEALAQIKREATLINISIGQFAKYLPITGVAKPQVWKEYGNNDKIIELDYSHLKLKKLPLIFTSVTGREGYSSITDKTPKECRIYVHWNKLEPIEKDNPEWRLNYCLFPQEDKEDEEVVMYKINSYPRLRKAVREGRQLLVYEDQVIDLGKFYARHPGGADTLRFSIGHEIGRWIYGSYEQAGRRHPHTLKAKELISKYTIGTIEDPLREALYSGMKPTKVIADSIFTLEGSSPINEQYTLLNLKNPEISINPAFGKVKDYGKYYAITSLTKDVTRNYTCGYVFDKPVMEAHSRLAKAIQAGQKFDPPFEEIETMNSDTINIAVKPSGPFSQWLVSPAALRTKFLVKGPFGSGLELDPDHKGAVACLVGGCGMTQIIDLIAYLFRLNAHRVGQSKGENYKVFANEEFNELSDPSFKLLLFTSFKNRKSVPYADILDALENWKKTYNFDNVQIFQRFTDETAEHYNGAYFKDKLPKDVTKIFMAGPKPFMHTIRRCLECNDYNPDLITDL